MTEERQATTIDRYSVTADLHEGGIRLMIRSDATGEGTFVDLAGPDAIAIAAKLSRLGRSMRRRDRSKH